MPQVAIVVSDGVMTNAVFEMIDALSLANRYTAQQYATREELPVTVDIRLVSLSGEPVRAKSGRMLAVDEGLRSVQDLTLNLIYVAPFAIGPPEMLAARLKPLASIADWLRGAHAGGVLIAGSGTGVAVLGLADLLANATVPVPWWLEKAMARRFPGLTLDSDRQIEAREDILLAGSHVAEPALAIRVLERIMSPDVATWVERITGVDRYPDGPDLAVAYAPTLLRPDELVTRAAHWLQLRFAKKPSMADLSVAMAVHPRTLSRRFSASLGMTPVEYLQGLRIEAAKRMLARSDRKIERVGYLVGYSDPAFFKALFRRQTGMTPAQFRRASGH